MILSGRSCNLRHARLRLLVVTLPAQWRQIRHQHHLRYHRQPLHPMQGQRQCPHWPRGQRVARRSTLRWERQGLPMEGPSPTRSCTPSRWWRLIPTPAKKSKRCAHQARCVLSWCVERSVLARRGLSCPCLPAPLADKLTNGARRAQLSKVQCDRLRALGLPQSTSAGNSGMLFSFRVRWYVLRTAHCRMHRALPWH